MSKIGCELTVFRCPYRRSFSIAVLAAAINVVLYWRARKIIIAAEARDKTTS
jgi:hypothetical protein